MIMLDAPLFVTAEAAAGSENYVGWCGGILLFAVENVGLTGVVPVEEYMWREATYDEMTQAVSEISQSIREDSK